MSQWKRIFSPQVFFLLIFPLLITDSIGAVSGTRSVSENGFNGTLTVHTDGCLELSMRDGSRIFLGPGALVEPRMIGKTGQPSLRRDQKGRVIFAADSQGVLIYTFRYNRDGSWVVMTDSEAYFTGFRFDGATGKIKEIRLPSGKRLRFP
jgi:hypothetical protein